ncbi:hypothetical protein BYT27DRAFT_6580338 [Phlegmacium glaucopus]|nr:hypothetical protein BYT27DRAFT_6580338 [Phlegmacium glaucopus]
MLSSPGPSAVEIQSHLYTSLLQASAYDVAIRVTGTWKAIYKLHRVVLIQSGFFRSLFTGGFSESSTRHRNPHDEIAIVFDDYNITRSAFELCISRLYGGGPQLHVSPSLIPTIVHPLTPIYSGITEVDEVPAGHHPATPGFLLSLLATAIYLSIPAIASQALSLILKTIGPSTVLQYLNFACGKPVLRTYPADDYTQAAVGLEHLAEMLDDFEALHISTAHHQTFKATESLISKDEGSAISLSTLNTSRSAELSDGGFGDFGEDGPSYCYGVVSDKIGEACSCWLARWATDMLHYEEGNDTQDFENMNSRAHSDSLLYVIETRKSASAILRPVIWGRGGLDAKWISALVSADTLFVRNERGRYNLARSIVELRRRTGIHDDEEKIWTQMFERDIYYPHMTFEDIFFISQDVSPTTKRPYVPLSVLQASHWMQSVLRHQVTYRPNVGSGSSPPPARDKELGITFTTAEILSKFSEVSRTDALNNDRFKPYFPVLGDSSLRIGDNGINSPTVSGTPLSMEELFTSCHSPSAGSSFHNGKEKARSEADTAITSKFYTSEANFFGLFIPRYVGASCVESDSTGKRRWSSYPPYRFSVEFWDVDLLKEKSRLHSHTIWYAGNLFNVYVQIVRKKGQAQLGIYLHRQSNVDPIPAASIPPLLSPTQSTKDTVPNSSFERSSHIRQTSLPSLVQQPTSTTQNTIHFSPSIHPSSRSSTPFTTVSHTHPDSPSSPSSTSAFNLSPFPSTLTQLTPPQPYRDPRSSISAYFAISCASATGSSQTRFSSSPDVFSVSQSWGWKSSTLQTEEFVEIGTQFLPTTNVIRNKEVSLRATVLVGLI